MRPTWKELTAAFLGACLGVWLSAMTWLLFSPDFLRALRAGWAAR